MTRRPRLATRPAPAFRASDGVPWPTDDELDLDAEWAALRESADIEWWADDEDPAGGGGPSDGPGSEAAADLDARLGHLELVVAERHRATAEEYRLIAAILADAAADPTPWVGPDPTLDGAWRDRRGRTAAAVRRDRLDMAQRAAVAEIALRLHLSEQTVRARATRAETLKERCPRLWRAFADGRTSERHAIETARLADSLPEASVDTTPPSDGDAVKAPVDADADATVDADADATVGADAAADATAAVWRAFDSAVTDRAARLVPAKFAVAARAIREKVHAESIDERHRRAASDRGVWMTPELDGMASLTALLPAADARRMMSQLDRAARHLRAAADEERTLAQLRADVLADLIVRPAGDAAPPPSECEPLDARRVSTTKHADSPALPHARSGGASPEGDSRGPSPAPPPPDGDAPVVRTAPSSPPSDASPAGMLESAAEPPGPRENVLAPRHPTPSPVQATVILTVPVLTLLGAGHEPATLEGYGPIDLGTARRLAGGAASWIRLLTDPVTAVPLALDRKTYRVPVALRRWLGVTSPTCVFPGCARAATDCDVDHRQAWVDGGKTDAENLDPECRHHHRIRHDTRWSPSATATGDTSWTSPLGARYDADPPPF
ncbi:DUF222 domain-containing protein [Microbacterium sp.]|uniref:HNH endonuclease signature motif containing protein n=1 Tax=Microbacterium sp. TaxID=51671 RepID=UPI00391C5EDA